MEKTLSIFEDGRFINPFSDFFNHEEKKSPKDVWNYITKRPKILPLTEYEKTEIHPVLKPDFNLINSEYDKETTIRSTWIGHSTCLIQMEGFTFITDPVWSKRCTPIPNLPFGPHRYRDPACSIKELPPTLDFVIISHAHYDHLDYDAVVEISKLFPNCHFYVPKGLKVWFQSASIKNVTELNWWDEINHYHHTTTNTTTTTKNNDNDDNCLKLIYTPANHSSQRGMFDRNKYLWGSWCVVGKNKRFYFSGDTADHDQLFKQISHYYGPFDFSLIAIGAYDLNREFMRSCHINVEEAVRIHKELNSKKSFGIHWGTYLLSSEPILEPPQLLIKESQKLGLKENEFCVSKIGETLIIKSDE
ncbi:beta-lactamase-like domain-containing protein [Dictyostelium discoideum AX4]|uniref:Beta-lactamase-like domain-containing protein n=1 Tax=Dictyostelium discoideum TaxID=44689 RepID=Q55BC7_DICDI|nr:beta-lactamase-like domain-containing protein [Dictyostelium discoideum AX4]EAL71765.1 beta-lactamase-like domain-containing protein [Dictyostelium discoideum AX4]|eukprot:XP_645685.1 beta-lactamase-like domain-containing protein [Dictyostelium discoideum AX4]